MSFKTCRDAVSELGCGIHMYILGLKIHFRDRTREKKKNKVVSQR